MNDVDRLSDEAMGASKAAHASHSDDAHLAAKKAHEAAYAAALNGNRPSLANHHLQEAATHGRHVDPTTKEGKQTAAFRASDKAKASGKPEDHDAAADAHTEARNAAMDAGHSKDASKHAVLSGEHKAKADGIRNPGQRSGSPFGMLM